MNQHHHRRVRRKINRSLEGNRPLHIRLAELIEGWIAYHLSP